MPFDSQRQIASPTGATLNLYTALPPGAVRGAVQINHGLAEHAARYGRFARFLAGRGFAVYAHDHRGHGFTTAPDAPLGSFGPGPGASNVVADVAAVLDAEGVATAHAVIGHAYGNRVARVFAVKHPERVRKLVLLAAGGGKPPPPEINAAIRKAVFGFDGAAREAAIALAFFAGETVPAAWVTGWYPLAALHQTRATTAQAYSSWSHGGSAPMLILQPADDTAAAPADSEKLAAQLGARATRHVIANAGHALLPEQPEAVASHILRYLDPPGKQ